LGGGVVIALMLGGLAACQEPPSVRLYNNAREPIVLHLDKGLEGADRMADDLVQVQPGSSRRFMAERMRGWVLRLTDGPCEVSYAFPRLQWNNPWGYHDANGAWIAVGRFPVDVQLQPDLNLYLKPRGTTGAASQQALDSAQAHGFPLAPLSKTCAAVTAPP
jgi:hypothetical protein